MGLGLCIRFQVRCRSSLAVTPLLNCRKHSSLELSYSESIPNVFSLPELPGKEFPKSRDWGNSHVTTSTTHVSAKVVCSTTEVCLAAQGSPSDHRSTEDSSKNRTRVS